ncbi:hypothetical protein P692DRAFT_20883442 [Suillus brevipes Sb2]|nr:hypothetical protein P692DRAFT_20883442 [Suillus brevipes Sb2]
MSPLDDRCCSIDHARKITAGREREGEGEGGEEEGEGGEEEGEGGEEEGEGGEDSEGDDDAGGSGARGCWD